MYHGTLKCPANLHVCALHVEKLQDCLQANLHTGNSEVIVLHVVCLVVYTPLDGIIILVSIFNVGYNVWRYSYIVTS